MNMAKKVNHRMRTPADYDYADHVEAVLGRTTRLRTIALAIILGLLCFLAVVSVSSDAWGFSIHEPGSFLHQMEQQDKQRRLQNQMQMQQMEIDRQRREIRRIQQDMKWQLDCRQWGNC